MEYENYKTLRMKSILTTLLFCVTSLTAVAQFAPPAGQAGSTALHKDSSIFVSWANYCSVQRGYQDISNPSMGLVSYGDSSMALGAPNSPNVVSLGDGGQAVLAFETPIVNGPGPDFAVFENSFVDTFLELAYVEVSSDGINFHRFPAVSNTQDTVQVTTFGGLDATKLYNLAGKYIGNYGTPFDLEELIGIAGLDVNQVTHVRIIDVVGCIQDSFARYDKNNNKINDPWRTDFFTGGFDLDAVGVINTWPTSVATQTKKAKLQLNVFPNPLKNGPLGLQFRSLKSLKGRIELFDPLGRNLYQNEIQIINGDNRFDLNLPALVAGHYFLKLQVADYVYSKKVSIQ